MDHGSINLTVIEKSTTRRLRAPPPSPAPGGRYGQLKHRVPHRPAYPRPNGHCRQDITRIVENWCSHPRQLDRQDGDSRGRIQRLTLAELQIPTKSYRHEGLPACQAIEETRDGPQLAILTVSLDTTGRRGHGKRRALRTSRNSERKADPTQPRAFVTPAGNNRQRTKEVRRAW